MIIKFVKEVIWVKLITMFYVNFTYIDHTNV